MPRPAPTPCHHPAPRRLAIAVLAGGLALAAGCRDAPEDVLGEARLALANRDEASFVDLLEPRSAGFLRTAPEVVVRSGRVYRVLRDGKPTPGLLPKGDVAEVIEQGHLAVVLVRQGKETARVPMRLIEGQWRIDLLEMDSFLEALRPRE